MATIYRFIVENRQSGGSSGNGRKNNSAPSKKTTAKGKWVSALSSPKGGVEHNRKMRAVNPLLNRATHGYWEKGMRVGRAGLGLVQYNTETGAMRFSGTAIAILISFMVTTFLKLQKKNLEWGRERNLQNYKSMENGVSAIHGEYSVTTNIMSGRNTYNENR
jgi:hypothetical protein